MRTLSEIEPNVRFHDLESLICDTHAMVDALYGLIDTHFSAQPNEHGRYVLDKSEGSRLFFLAGLAFAMSKKSQDAYYMAWDNAKKVIQAASPVKETTTAKAGPAIEPDRLSMFGLFSLYDALGTIYDVVAGLASQPRFTDGEKLPLHGDML